MGKPDWKNYKDIYDIYRNGTKILRKYGKKASIETADSLSGGLFGRNRIEVINIFSGEVVYDVG